MSSVSRTWVRRALAPTEPPAGTRHRTLPVRCAHSAGRTCRWGGVMAWDELCRRRIQRWFLAHLRRGQHGQRATCGQDPQPRLDFMTRRCGVHRRPRDPGGACARNTPRESRCPARHARAVGSRSKWPTDVGAVAASRSGEARFGAALSTSTSRATAGFAFAGSGVAGEPGARRARPPAAEGCCRARRCPLHCGPDRCRARTSGGAC